ncbi:uncharacterized protein LOC129747402 [Uranotaenia lowii]|uniref:uncharacterized protein LOC129747402 n=1 Tax=Uranotaenia lowii TaxID=190385 RepID=UPI00247AC259|nr:uncharacterized protein LOC129747402 [Uranotaenia lowii]
MKRAIVLSFLIALCVVKVTSQRPKTLRVIDDLRNTEPYHKSYRDFVLEELNKARLSASDVTSDFYQNMANVKESYVKLALDGEESLLDDVDRNVGDSACLDFIRNSTEHNMYMAGIYFTNCIDELDVKLSAETSSVYLEMQQDERSYINNKLLDVFRRENMVLDPETISNKFEKKQESLKSLPTGVVSKLASIVNRYRDRLVSVRNLYEQCLINNKNLLDLIFENTGRQLATICRHRVV